MGNFNLPIPEELHHKFKVIATKKKTMMKDILINLLSDYVTKEERRDGERKI